jgi:WhiB family transcriptional regulator, redox-sensing transcriptional regulator
MGEPRHDFYEPDWMLEAECLGHTELFFAPDESESRAERKIREAEAKSVCRACDMRSECLSEALKSEERFGIWGGLTERERRSARRAQLPFGSDSPQDIADPGRLARLPAAVVQGRPMSPRNN